jgi:hypothetical protein
MGEHEVAIVGGRGRGRRVWWVGVLSVRVVSLMMIVMSVGDEISLDIPGHGETTAGPFIVKEV